MVDWAGSAQAAVIPFGAGSSVVGGVEARVDGDAYRAAISVEWARRSVQVTRCKVTAERPEWGSSLPG